MSKRIEDLNECWCCGGLNEQPSLCPSCSRAGCNRFTDECKSDHKTGCPNAKRRRLCMTDDRTIKEKVEEEMVVDEPTADRENCHEANAESTTNQSMSDDLNERAARQLAEDKGFDPEKIRYCHECGRTVVLSENYFSEHSDNVYCTCDERGPPMVTLSKPISKN